MTSRSDPAAPPLHTVPRIVCVDDPLLVHPRVVAHLGPIRVWDTGALVALYAITQPRSGGTGADEFEAGWMRRPRIADVELGVEIDGHGRQWHGKSSPLGPPGASGVAAPTVRFWRGHRTSANRLMRSWFMAQPPHTGPIWLGVRVTPVFEDDLAFGAVTALAEGRLVDLRAG